MLGSRQSQRAAADEEFLEFNRKEDNRGHAKSDTQIVQRSLSLPKTTADLWIHPGELRPVQPRTAMQNDGGFEERLLRLAKKRPGPEGAASKGQDRGQPLGGIKSPSLIVWGGKRRARRERARLHRLGGSGATVHPLYRVP